MQEQLYDIYDMWHTPFWQTSLFYGVIAVGLFLLFSAIIVVIVRLKHKKQKKLYWQVFLERIDLLDESRLIEPRSAKVFYSELTKILKCYLSLRFHPIVISKTDQELVAFLKTIEFPANLNDDVQSIFTGSTYIKFAGEQALEDRILKDLQAAKNIIYKTIASQQSQ